MAIRTKDLNDMQLALFNVDYPVFAKAFNEAGGNYPMAKHLWTKWKDTHNDDFLAEFGNMDIQNKKITTKMINKLIALERNREEYRRYARASDIEWTNRRKLGNVC